MQRLSNAQVACWAGLLVANILCSNAHCGEMLYGVKDVGGLLVVRSLDLSNSTVQQRGALAHAGTERVSAIFQGRDRSLNVVRISTKRDVGHRTLIHRIGVPEMITDATSRLLTGLDATQSVSGLFIPNSGPAIALIAHYTDTPPFSFATLDLQSWKASALHSPGLNPTVRYGHLTKCPDGSMYASTRKIEQNVHLVRIRLDEATTHQVVELTLYGRALRNDVSDLACAPSGELYALADPQYAGTNSVFAVNLATGVLTPVQAFDVERMVFIR